MVIGAGRPFVVLDRSGAPIGTLLPQAVLDTVIGKDARP
jgi:hypothetical protein